MSRLVVMGSGETAPTMIKPHRAIFSQVPGPAVMLDTPFGFQMNADELVQRTMAYFADSVGTPVSVARWRRADEDQLEHERTLALLAQAGWAFAGPGSPSYALRHWTGTPVPAALLDVVRRGGTLVFGSAAACTLGSHTIPVYEIYKVGEEPRWLVGLDLLAALTGIEAVVIPHYDNAEGGNHDTRYCYLGEQRLALLETELPDRVGVLGVDEHTGLLLDLTAGTATVFGNGVLTVRRRDGRSTFGAGTELPIAELAARLRGEPGWTAGERSAPDAASAVPTAAPARIGTPEQAAATSLRMEADAAQARFDIAQPRGDVDSCVGAVLDLEAAIVAWSSDTDQNDDVDHARRVLRGLVVRLGELARHGVRDPADAVRAYVDALLELRGRARTGKDYPTADLIRDRLAAAGVEVQDTPEGVHWSLPRHG